uniref:Inositol-1-monophosphatase n=1 Tax=Alexandrium monilatum TaxID=311494 RepID=A0A7S4PTC2_9DINO
MTAPLPDDHPHAPRLRLALAIAAEAAETIHRWAGRVSEYELKTERGDPTDPVTAIDKEVEAAAVARIRAAFPGDAVVAEEGHRDRWEPEAGGGGRWAWILDPIDGTKNFIHGSPHCCVSLAVADGPQVELGVVAAPLLGETFWAARGFGAFSSARGRLHVSPTRELHRAAVTFDVNARDGDTLSRWLERCRRMLAHPVQTLRNHGSAALELCMVARGSAEAHLEAGLDLWDVAAGWLIAVEAGGAVWNLDGKPLRSLQDFKGDIVACNSQELAEALFECLGAGGTSPPPARL